MRIVPLTGFARSGSTLLMSLLEQNPTFYGGDDSELGNLLSVSINFIQQNIAHFQLDNRDVEKSFINYCNAGVNAWVDSICPKDKIFIDKSRHWTTFLDLYFKIIKDTKVIFIQRDLRGIVNSYEKKRCESIYYNKDSEEHCVINDSVVLQRALSVLRMNYIENAILSSKIIKETNNSYKENVYFCRYEDLVKNPKQELNNIYNFLDLPFFTHDFNDVKQKPFNDNPYLPWGDHKIKSKVEYKEEIYEYIDKKTEEFILTNYKWYYDFFYPEVK